MKNYLLCIGVGHYLNSGEGIPDLGDSPLDDCEVLSRVLCGNSYGFELVQPLLLDQYAISRRIIDSLDSLATLEEESQLLILFSGHGEYIPDINMSYWLAHDANPSSEFDMSQSALDQGWISAEIIIKKINSVKCRHILILADCCFAGHLFYNYKGIGSSIYPDYLKLAVRKRSREVCVPCGMARTPNAIGGSGTSPFINAVVEFLDKNKGYRGPLSVKELHASIYSLKDFSPRYGHLGCDAEYGGGFLFAHPQELGAMLEEPFEEDGILHHVMCRKIEQKFRPISSVIDRDRYLKDFVGRQWVLDEVEQWINEDKSPLFWLTGEPGVGKSAISAYLVEHSELIRVHHFFLFDKNSTLDLKQVAKSLAYQLSCYLPEYAEFIDNIDEQSLFQVDEQSLFDELIIRPLTKEIITPTLPIIMLFDGLDEASANGKNRIAEYLALLLKSTSGWLRIILTSRSREHEINQPLAKYNPWVLPTSDPRNIADLRRYLMAKWESEPLEQSAVSAILERSEGSFLYIAYICDEWGSSTEIPDVDVFPKGLAGVYESFFRRRFPELDYFESQVIPFLECIFGVLEPIQVSAFVKYLGYTERETYGLIRRFGSLLRFSEIGAVEFCHKSLADWISSDSSSEYYISKMDARNRLALFGWEYWLAHQSKLDGYFLKYLASHLVASEELDKVHDLLIDGVYLEAKVAGMGVFDLLEDFGLYEWESSDLDDMQQAISYNVDFISRCPDYFFQVVYFHLARNGKSGLRSDPVILDWRKRYFSMHGGIMEPRYDSGVKVDQLIYEVPLPDSSLPRLQWADEHQIICSDKKDVLVVETKSGRKVNTVQYRGIDSRDSSYSHGKLYFPLSTDTLVVQDLASGEEWRCSREHNPDDWRICARIFSGWGDDYAFWVDQDLSELQHVYIINFTSEKWEQIYCGKAHVNQIVDNGGYIAISLSDMTLEVLNKWTGKRVKKRAHENYIWSIQFVGGRLFSCSDDGAIKEWDPNNLEVLRTICCAEGIMSLHVYEDVICAGGRDGYIYCWDHGQLQFKQRVFSSGISGIRYISEYRWVSAVPVSDDKMIVVSVDGDNSNNAGYEKLFDGSISAMLFSACGKYLVLGGGTRLVLYDVVLNLVVNAMQLDGYVASMVLSESSDRIYLSLEGRCYHIVKIPELEILEHVVLSVGFFTGMAYESNTKSLHCLLGMGFGVVSPPCGNFLDYYEFREDLRERIGYASMCICDGTVYLSSSDHVRVHAVGNIPKSRHIPYKRSCDRGVAKVNPSTLLLADLRAPLVALDEKSGEVRETFPFFVSDLNYIASKWDEPKCLTLGTNNDGTVLVDIQSKKVLSMIPQRFDILLRHPSRPLWAVSFLQDFGIISVEDR